MKKLVLGLVMASMFIGTVVLGSASLNAPHKGLKGKDGATINCAYCHTAAGNPKAGKDYAKYKTGPFCKGSGCH
jgi:cytochrome c553